MRNSKLDGATHGSIIGRQSGVAQSHPARPVTTKHAGVKSFSTHTQNVAPDIGSAVAADAHHGTNESPNSHKHDAGSVGNVYSRKRGKAPAAPTDNAFCNPGGRDATAMALLDQQGQFRG